MKSERASRAGGIRGMIYVPHQPASFSVQAADRPADPGWVLEFPAKWRIVSACRAQQQGDLLPLVEPRVPGEAALVAERKV